MSNIEKESVVNELTEKAKKDVDVTKAINEISETTGLREKDVLKAFVSMEVDKELEAQSEAKIVKESIKE